MKRLSAVIVFVVMFSLLAPTSAVPADDAKVKKGMSQVEGGAKKIPTSQIGDGVQQTAKGVGTTVSEGAKYSGEKLKDAGQATKAPAKSAWGSVKNFFTKPFSN